MIEEKIKRLESATKELQRVDGFDVNEPVDIAYDEWVSASWDLIALIIPALKAMEAWIEEDRALEALDETFDEDDDLAAANARIDALKAVKAYRTAREVLENTEGEDNG